MKSAVGNIPCNVIQSMIERYNTRNELNLYQVENSGSRMLGVRLPDVDSILNLTGKKDKSSAIRACIENECLAIRNNKRNKSNFKNRKEAGQTVYYMSRIYPAHDLALLEIREFYGIRSNSDAVYTAIVNAGRDILREGAENE